MGDSKATDYVRGRLRGKAEPASSGRILIKIVLTLIVPLAGSVAHAALLVVFACWAALGRRRAIEALTLLWLGTSLNQGIYAPSPAADVLRWLVIGAALASVSVHTARAGWSVPRAWLWLCVFTVVAGLLSIHVSYAVDISLLKLISFFIGVTAVLLAFHQTRHEATYWRAWFFSLFVLVVVLGFPLIFSPVGYVVNGRGFQGLLNHPQAYAVFIAPLLGWHLARLMTREIGGIRMWLLAGIAAVSLVATEARTGVIAVGGGILSASLLWIATGRTKFAVSRTWVLIGSVLTALVVAWAAVRWGTVSTTVTAFVMKSEAVGNITDAFYASRGFVVERSWENIRRQPLTGIGFGLASDPSMLNIRRDPVLGLPVGASVEKGIAAIGLLEEVGVIGFLVFIVALGSVLRPVLTKHAPFPAAVLALSALMTNFGEATLFALGGSGLLVWLLLGSSRTAAMQTR